MSVNKKTSSGWILCPSKTFRGKFYYFNTNNGATLWSSDEMDKKMFHEIDNVPRIIDKCHCYPEPSSPPDDENYAQNTRNNYNPRSNMASTSTSQGTNNPFMSQPHNMNFNYSTNFNHQNSTNSNKNTPKFMPPIFSNYESYEEPYVPDVMWIPIHLPRSFLFQNNPRLKQQPMLDQITQTYDTENPDKCTENLTKFKDKYAVADSLESSDYSQAENSYQIDRNYKPKRRNSESNGPPPNYTKSADKSYENTKFKNQYTIIDSTPSLKFSDYSENENSYQINGNCKRKKRHSESNTTDRNEHILKRKRCFTEGETSHTSKSDNVTDGILNCSLSPRHRVDFPTATCISDNNITSENIGLQNKLEEDFIKGLNKNDLRFCIIAKKKIVQHSNGYNEKMLQDENPKENKEQNTPKKKKVTFNLEVQGKAESDSSMRERDGDIDDITYQDRISIEKLRRLANPTLKPGYWYIVIDMDVLLEEFDYIDNYVQRDPNCILLLAHAVRLRLDAICSGESYGRQQVAVARQLSRKLATVVKHRVVQTEVAGETQLSVNECVLNCCLDVMSKKYHVVLITNDDNLYTKARSIDIHCFKLQQIKDGLVFERQPTFVLNKFQITVTNDSETKDNMSIDVSDRESGGNTNNEFINNNKIDIKENKSITRPFCFGNTDYDATDAIANNSDKLIDITKLQFAPLNMKQHTNNNDKEPKNCTEINEINFQKDTNKSFKKSISLFDNNNFETDSNGEKRENEFETRTFEFQNEFDSSFKNTHTAMENELKRFFIKNTAMNVRLKIRMDEWVCQFNQIMENVLFDIIQKYVITIVHSDVPPPWSVYEAIEIIGEVYQDSPEMVKLVDNLTDLLMRNNRSNSENLRSNIKPNVFIKIFGYGFLLIEELKKILPNSEELEEALELLNNVLYVMEDPGIDPDLDLESLKTASIHDYGVIKHTGKRNFIKPSSDVMEYLMKHYPNAYDVNETTDVKEKTNPKEPQIFRLFGKDLNSVKINKSKSITIDNAEKLNIDTIKDPCAVKENDIFNQPLHGNTFDDVKQTAGPKVIRKLNIINAYENKIKNSTVLENTKSIKNTELSKIDAIDDINVIQIGDDNDEVKKTVNAGPKLIRNFTVIKKYQNKLHSNLIDHENNDNLSVETLIIDNRNDIDDFNDSFNYVTNMNNKIGVNSDDVTENCNNITKNYINNQFNHIDNKIIAIRNDFESRVYCFVKIFFVELSSSLIAIHTFIKNCIKVLRYKNVEDEKKDIQKKTINVQTHLCCIINILKRIIERESTDNVMKQLLINTGVSASKDIRMIKYRQVVAKCLEQARILERALKLILQSTDDDCKSTVSNESVPTKYINIFE